MSTRRALLAGISLLATGPAVADPQVASHNLLMSRGPGVSTNTGLAPGTVGHVPMSRGATSDYVSVMSSFVPITNPVFGGVADPATDNTAAITASLSALGYAYVPDGDFGWGANFSLTAGQRLIGQSQNAVLHALADVLTVAVAGSNTEVSNLSISSARTTSDISSGFITIGNAASSIDNIWIDHVKFAAPNHGLDAVEVLSTPTCNITNCTISNCLVVSVGRMGFEILSNSTGQVTNLWIINNSITNTGGVDNGMGVSLSANLNDCDVSNNYFNNCPVSCVELVGGLVNTAVHDNRFAGTSTNTVISSNATQAIGLQVYNNSSDSSTVGNWLLNACPNAHVHSNLIYGTLIQLSSNGIWFHHNRVISTSATAVIVDNHSGCTVEDNYIDNSANGANTSTLRCFNTGATANLLRNNILAKGTGGVYSDNNGGAAKNVFYGNRRDSTDGAIDNGNVSPNHLVLGNTTSAVRVITFPGISNVVFRPYTVTVNLAGADSSGLNALNSSRIISLVARLGSSPSIITDLTLSETGVTLAVTLGTDTVTITATPSGGTQVYNWDVEVSNPDMLNAVLIS